MSRFSQVTTGVAGAMLLLSACSSQPAVEAEQSEAQSTPAATQVQELTVFAAASLGKSFDEIIAVFEKENPGVTVVVSYEGSQDLVAHLVDGAEADVLATANTKTMESADEKELVDTPQEFAANTLTLIVPAGNPAKVTGINETLEAAKLVICAPEVPCGNATKKLQEHMGVNLSPVSEENKVTDVRAKVEVGEADAGIVYATDARAAGDKVEVIEIPDNGVLNRYPIAVTRTSDDKDLAQRFVDLVVSDRGQAILSTHGFLPPQQ